MLHYEHKKSKKSPVENRWPQFYSSQRDMNKTQEKNKTKLRKADKSSKLIFFASIKSKATLIHMYPQFFVHLLFTDWQITYFFLNLEYAMHYASGLHCKKKNYYILSSVL